jgi:hypothetical protein
MHPSFQSLNIGTKQKTESWQDQQLRQIHYVNYRDFAQDYQNFIQLLYVSSFKKDVGAILDANFIKLGNSG